MVVGVLSLDLHFHVPQSLKQKRGLVKKLQARIRNRFPVSCAETGCHDLWQRCTLGVAMVAMSEAEIHRVFEQIETELESSGLAELGASQSELLHYATDDSD